MEVDRRLLPITAGVNKQDHLTLGGCDTKELASEYGTPLYVYDEDTLRHMCREFIGEFTQRYSKTKVLYAAKAFINPVLVKIVRQEGLGMDVVSGGELAVSVAYGMSPEDVYFHGNNKSIEEIQSAIDCGVGRVVVDNLHELHLLSTVAQEQGRVQDVLIRLSPGVDAHTHSKITTGILDSKFGISIETGDAEKVVREILCTPGVNLVGIHSHLGSQMFELEPFSIAIDTILTFASKLVAEGLDLKEFSTGGGFAIGYQSDQIPLPVSAYAEVITTAVKSRSADLGLLEPTLIIEPGRAIVGRAGVALYTVGSTKQIPNVRKYVSLDGGMGDNIRPALYDSRYEAVVANRISDRPAEVVTLAGKYCESGDVLVQDIALPVLNSGDVIAIPASGAYAVAMSNNYNLNPKPAIVMVRDGKHTLIRRRETYSDMMMLDVSD